MSDESLPQLERAFRVFGAPQGEARLLRARLRQGGLAWGSSVYMGHEAAMIACDKEQLEVPKLVCARLSHLPPAERAYWEQVSLSIPRWAPA